MVLTNLKIREVRGMGDNSKNKKSNDNALTADEMKSAPHSAMNTAIMKGEAEDVGGIAGKRLLSFFDRIERMEEEKAALMEDIKEIYAEAKSAGFDTGIMKQVYKLKNMDSEKRQENDELINLYMAAIGMR